ncbi:hypothetical protein, partial [Acidiferrobacter sp.]|uniref:hypothetical protein n=1 Tax=Acidiferrobacter sp. TaxID=1872107 RepID=UPI00262B59C0
IIAARPVPLTVVASSRKGLGGHCVYYPKLSSPNSMTFGPHGRLYFIDGFLGHVLLALSHGTISIVADAGQRGYVWVGTSRAPRRVPAYNMLQGVAITPKGTIYTLWNGAFSRITPQGRIVFVPLHTPGNRALLNPNNPATPGLASFHYPPFSSLATGPGGHVYLSARHNWRLAPGHRLVLVRNPCHAPVELSSNSLSGPHGRAYVVGGPAVRVSASTSPDCPVTKIRWKLLFYDPRLHLRGLPAVSPHGRFLYVASRTTIYRLPLASLLKPKADLRSVH